MRRIWWSTLVLVLGGAAGTWWGTSYLTRQQTATIVQNAPAQPSGEEESQFRPTVVLPRLPPNFLFDAVEPIVVQPQEDDPLLPPVDLTVAPPDVQKVKLRMPYADERVSPDTPTDGMAFWSGLVDLLQDVLATIDTPGQETTVQEAESTGPPEPFPTAEPEALPKEMPVIPIDPHHGFPNCPHLGGCTRGYPHMFPQPAYHFTRPEQKSTRPLPVGEPVNQTPMESRITPEVGGVLDSLLDWLLGNR